MGFMKGWKDRVEREHIQLTEVAKRMKHWVDQGRREMELQVGDQVLLKLGKEQFKPPIGQASALMQRLEGPFEIFVKIGEVVYKLKLLDHFKVFHSIVHVSQLKPCRIDENDPSMFRRSPTHVMILDIYTITQSGESVELSLP